MYKEKQFRLFKRINFYRDTHTKLGLIKLFILQYEVKRMLKRHQQQVDVTPRKKKHCQHQKSPKGFEDISSVTPGQRKRSVSKDKTHQTLITPSNKRLRAQDGPEEELK